MNASVLLIPFILIRIVSFRLTNLDAYNRAQKFVPLGENQKVFYVVYQICQLLLLIMPVFYQIAVENLFHFLGVFFYVAGLLMVRLAILSFTETNQPILYQKGVYRVSRHPMYIGYFLFYFGVGLWMESFLYIVTLTFFVVASHQIILAEEKWCIDQYGESYKNYMKRVRRYI